MASDDMLSIGAFAMLCGLSVTTLRHYDDVDVLKPAWVDPVTGYRRYRLDQVGQARLVSALRGVALPLDEIRKVAGDVAAIEATLTRHRGRLSRQARAMAAMVSTVDEYLEKGVPMPVIDGCRPVQIRLNVTDRADAVPGGTEVYGPVKVSWKPRTSCVTDPSGNKVDLYQS